MKKPLHILHLEDSLKDAELVREMLAAEGVASDVVRVDNRADFLAALEKGGFELILAEYSLPSFDAPRVLHLLQERGLDIPLIVVTAKVNDEVAVECMKQGATDYLLKDRPARLGEAVKHALQEKKLRDEKQRADQALKASDEKLAALFEAAPGAIVVSNRAGHIIHVNEQAETLFGYSPQELLGKPVEILVPERLRERHIEHRANYYSQPRTRVTSIGLELTGRRKNGSEFPAEISLSPKETESDLFVIAIIRDVTERKRAEGALHQLTLEEISQKRTKAVSDLAVIFTLSILVLGLAHHFDVFENVSVWVLNYRKTGIDELITTFVFLAFAFLGFSYRRWKELKAQIIGRKKVEEALRTLHGELERRVQERTADLTKSNKRLQDEAAERKRAEKERTRLASIIEATTDLVGIADPQGHLLYLNQNARKMFGIGEDEDILGLQIRDFHSDPARKLVFEEAIPTAIREGVWSGENALLSRDGREIPVSQMILAHRAPDGSVEFLSTIIRDITERKRSEQEIHRNLERIRALHEIDVAITSTLDLRTVLNILLEKIDLSFFYLEASTVRLLNRATGAIEPVACRNIDEEEWKSRENRDPALRAKTVIETRAPLIVHNLLTDPSTDNPNEYLKRQVVSYLGLPLIAKDEVLGVLGLYTNEECEFTQEELEILNAVAGQAAIAIHNSQLYHDVQKREAEIQQAHKDLEVLYAVTTTASQSLNLDMVLNEVIRKVTEIFAFDATRIFLFDPSMKTLLLRASHEASPEPFVTGGRFRRSQGVVGAVAERGEPIILADVLNDPRYQEMSYWGNIKKAGFRFFAAFPIKSKLQTTGVISFLQYNPRSLSPREIELLMAMTRQIGIAVENTGLFEEISQRADELTLKTLELERANKVKDEFLSIVSHELRTPLNVMMGYTGLLREGMFGALNPQQDDALKKMAIQSSDLLGIVTNLLRATQISSGEIKAERATTDLGQLLDELKNSYDLPMNNELTINWDFPSDLPIVETDSEKLRHIMVNLINNAIKFTEKGSVRITARHLPKTKTLRFTVADTGLGIAKESLPNIFDLFHQVDGSDTRLHGGLGLGLYLAKNFVELLGGKIKVKSALGRGSVFTVALPYESNPAGVPRP